MSAWLVEKATIDLLVQAAIVEGLIPLADADRVGREAWTENHLSLAARYGDEVPEVEYRFDGIEAPLEDAIVHRTLGCLDYQACEHDAWPASPTFALVDALRTRIEARNPAPVGDADFDDFTRSWEREHGRIPWGIDSLDQAVRRS